MARRATLPGAEELFFNSTPVPAGIAQVGDLQANRGAGGGQADPRPKHEQKVTFYCTGADLNDLERVRLALRADHRLPSDRSRIVRAALAEMLEEFDSLGAGSRLVLRLRDEA
ncbi:MAG: hypothetical protein ACT4OM_02620 [Actinomycetota bacterium]